MPVKQDYISDLHIMTFTAYSVNTAA